MDPLMLGTLVGLSMLLALAGGIATLAGYLLVPRLRAWQARRHPQQAVMRERTRQARRLAAEWPLLVQTLGLGYRDQWTRQHRFPAAEIAVDGQGVTATVSAIAGAGLADCQRAAGSLADTWGCVSVRAERQGPGLIRLRSLRRDPLLTPARIDLPGTAPASLTSWWLGWAEDGTAVFVRQAEVSGSVVAGLAGFGKTMLVAHLRGQLAPSPAVQFVLIDGKGGPDNDRLIPRAWLSAKDDLDQVRDALRQVHRLMVDRQAAIAQVLGVTDAWHLGPSKAGRWSSWSSTRPTPSSRAQGHLTGGQGPQLPRRRAVAAGRGTCAEGPQRRHPSDAVDPAGHRGCHPDPHPRQLPGRHLLRHPDGGWCRGRLGEEIRQHPDASPVLLNDPAYVGVTVTSLPGRPGFHRVRTPLVDRHQVAAVIRSTAGLRRDPAVLLADQAPGLRVLPPPGDVA
jgi:hypothetical protein